jgi:hypothetical protein
MRRPAPLQVVAAANAGNLSDHTTFDEMEKSLLPEALVGECVA